MSDMDLLQISFGFPVGLGLLLFGVRRCYYTLYSAWCSEHVEPKHGQLWSAPRRIYQVLIDKKDERCDSLRLVVVKGADLPDKASGHWVNQVRWPAFVKQHRLTLMGPGEAPDGSTWHSAP